jgi:hypothetical protein
MPAPHIESTLDGIQSKLEETNENDDADGDSYLQKIELSVYELSTSLCDSDRVTLGGELKPQRSYSPVYPNKVSTSPEPSMADVNSLTNTFDCGNEMPLTTRSLLVDENGRVACAMPPPWDWRATSDAYQTKEWKRTTRQKLLIVMFLLTCISATHCMLFQALVNWTDPLKHLQFNVFTSIVFWDALDFNAFPVYVPRNVSSVYHALRALADEDSAIPLRALSSQAYDRLLGTLRPIPSANVSVGHAVASCFFFSLLVTGIQTVSLMDPSCCTNYMAHRMAQGRNVLRWIDLCVSVPVAMLTMSFLSGQTDQTVLFATYLLAGTSILIWTLADEWNWLLWSTQRIQGINNNVVIQKATVVPRPRCIKRIAPNLIGWVPFAAAWGVVWVRFGQLQTGATLNSPTHALPLATFPVVFIAFTAQVAIGLVQLVRHSLTPTANKALIGEVVSALANVVSKTALLVGTLVITQNTAYE